MDGRADGTGLWIWTHRAGVVAVLSVMLYALDTNVGALLVVPFLLFSGLASDWIFGIQRSRWGAGPAALMADPVDRARKRRSDLLFVGLVLVALVIGVFH